MRRQPAGGDGAIARPEPVEIGQRARTIRRRRGLSLTVAAGLAGISKPYLSMLERGERRWERRGLIEDVAGALGCSLADLTGQPYPPADRHTADALATLPGLRLALNDYAADETPTTSPRPLDQLLSLADDASRHRDQARYSVAGRDLGPILLDLQAHAYLASGADRQRALAALVESWMVAAAIAKNFGYLDLSVATTRRGHEYARLLDPPGLLGFARWYWALGLMRVGARNRAAALLTSAVDDLTPAVNLAATDTTVAEMVGLMHLTSAQTAARSGASDDAHAHLDEAERIARRVGERNTLRRHFGPTNVASWRLAVGIELGEGARAHADASRLPIHVESLDSKERSSALHLDFARALAQENGSRDWDAIRHLDTADRIAPQLIRPDPLARDLVAALDRRARRRVWELDSLRNRFGMVRPS